MGGDVRELQKGLRELPVGGLWLVLLGMTPANQEKELSFLHMLAGSKTRKALASLGSQTSDCIVCALCGGWHRPQLES